MSGGICSSSPCDPQRTSGVEDGWMDETRYMRLAESWWLFKFSEIFFLLCNKLFDPDLLNLFLCFISLTSAKLSPAPGVPVVVIRCVIVSHCIASCICTHGSMKSPPLAGPPLLLVANMNQSASLTQNSSRRSALLRLVRGVQRNPAVPGDSDPPITNILLPLLSSERHSSILGTPLCTVLRGLFTVKHFKLLEGTFQQSNCPHWGRGGAGRFSAQAVKQSHCLLTSGCTVASSTSQTCMHHLYTHSCKKHAYPGMRRGCYQCARPAAVPVGRWRLSALLKCSKHILLKNLIDLWTLCILFKRFL